MFMLHVTLLLLLFFDGIETIFSFSNGSQLSLAFDPSSPFRDYHQPIPLELHEDAIIYGLRVDPLVKPYQVCFHLSSFVL